MALDNSVSMVSYLQNNSGAIQTVVTIVLVIVTAVYVHLTKKLSDVAKSQLDFQVTSEKNKITQEIIENCLRYIFRIKEDLNHLRAKKFQYMLSKDLSHDKTTEAEQALYEEAYRRIDNNMFTDLMFISFQLKRIKTHNLWTDFEKIANIFEEMFNALLFPGNMPEYEALEQKYSELSRQFVNKCIDITNV